MIGCTCNNLIVNLVTNSFYTFNSCKCSDHVLHKVYLNFTKIAKNTENHFKILKIDPL